MKRILLFITILLCAEVMAQNTNNTDFWQKDKIMHSVGSFGISTITYTYLSIHPKHKNLPELQKRLISLSTTIIIGSLKEVVDSTSSNHYASWGDMGANAIGALTFQAVVTIPLNFNTRHKRKKQHYN
ncbi:uncharacterized protein YfiM (DUF2279 family) [Aquimarina sp. EL_43]|uniref:hypothetical protein n=1 Tax=unclassified Aquimarina TaxID=2627091 RepID=UPI001A2F9315|nr:MULTISPECIES: hypothetical protein [unclassified Aquimarina]MBG6129125.1 uncharacterized protein YfiM (DUF2279 family) [Aquimarina sp. EL_35]MBG6150190.1 uncharacterized protein YfiM (DUF2279 family) [Aquimarina sp. EL_32]MBG6167125.1 uncharacterized protein YfiM (DUF2279 family) [Aquimarina sp. EL_43]